MHSLALFLDALPAKLEKNKNCKVGLCIFALDTEQAVWIFSKANEGPLV